MSSARASRNLADHRRGDSRHRHAAVAAPGSPLGGARRVGVAVVLADDRRRDLGSHPQRRRRLLVPLRHDAARRACAPAHAVRLARRLCGDARARHGVASVPADLWGRRAGDDLPVERCHGGRADAGRLCGRAGRPRAADAVFVRLRVHRERGKFRPADLQSGQSRRLWRRHAGARRVADAFRPGLRLVHPRDLLRAARHAARGTRRAGLAHRAAARPAGRRAHRGARHRSDGRGLDVRLG